MHNHIDVHGTLIVTLSTRVPSPRRHATHVGEDILGHFPQAMIEDNEELLTLGKFYAVAITIHDCNSHRDHLASRHPSCSNSRMGRSHRREHSKSIIDKTVIKVTPDSTSSPMHQRFKGIIRSAQFPTTPRTTLRLPTMDSRRSTTPHTRVSTGPRTPETEAATKI